MACETFSQAASYLFYNVHWPDFAPPLTGRTPRSEPYIRLCATPFWECSCSSRSATDARRRQMSSACKTYGYVTGRVLDAMTNRPTPNALVSVGSLYTTHADVSGAFTSPRRRRRSNRHRPCARLRYGDRGHDDHERRHRVDRLHPPRPADRSGGSADPRAAADVNAARPARSASAMPGSERDARCERDARSRACIPGASASPLPGGTPPAPRPPASLTAGSQDRGRTRSSDRYRRGSRPHARIAAIARRSAASASRCSFTIDAALALFVPFVYVDLPAQHVDALLVLFDHPIDRLHGPAALLRRSSLSRSFAKARFERADAHRRFAPAAFARLGRRRAIRSADRA